MNTKEPVYLKDTSNQSGQMAALAGFCSLFCVPFGIYTIVQGDWRGLLGLAVPAIMVAAGKWIASTIPENYVALHGDRIEFPDRKNSVLPLLWSEVKKICWMVEDDNRSSIRFHVPASEQRLMGQVNIQLDNVSPENRLILIRYVREVGSSVEQEGWPSFCRKRAVRLAEYCQSKKVGGAPDADDGSRSPIPGYVGRLTKQHPFLAGAVILPVTAAFMFLRLLSRRTWWLFAGLISVSAIINIRLIWGAWVAPFTKICLGMAIVFFAIGLIAPASVPASRKTRVSDLTFYSVLVLFVIGFPLFGNAAVLGWLPRPVARVGGYAFLVLFCGLPVLMSLTAARREAKERSALESDALRRWEVYEETGVLPESDLDEDSES